jgi:hypothetical protein
LNIFKLTSAGLLVVAMTALVGNPTSATANNGDNGVIDVNGSDSVSFAALFIDSEGESIVGGVSPANCESAVAGVIGSDCAGFNDGGSDCDSLAKVANCSGCGSCGGCKCASKSFYLGVEATFLAPNYDNGLAEFTLIDPFTTGVTIGSDFGQADELKGAPRITLGWGSKDKIGIQARYWEFDNTVSFSQIPAFTGGANHIQPFGGGDTFDAYTIDLELTKQFCRGDWDLLGTFGARYADYDHARNNAVIGAVNGDLYSLSSVQGESFHGTGLTFSLSGLRPLKRKPCLALYVSARGSTLFGEVETLAETSSSFYGPSGNAGSVNGALASSDETLFMAEIQAGLQWSRCVRSFNGRMFARAVFEYQYWGADDPSAVAYSESFSIPANSFGSAYAEGGEHDFDLIGFSIATGFAW